jgi:hypothetical protein
MNPYPKTLTSINSVVDLTLSTNFVYIPLCDATNRYKYSIELNRCVAFASCTSDNTGKYCIDDNTPLTCNANYFINLYDNNTILCLTYCDEGKMRLPGSPELYGICNTNCPDNINELFEKYAHEVHKLYVQHRTLDTNYIAKQFLEIV